MSRNRRRGRMLMLAAVLAVVGVCPLLAHRYLPPVQFNQFLIERADASYGVRPIATRWQRLCSAYSSGLNAIAHLAGREPPDLDRPEEVLRYVLAWAPGYAIVYPTEIFYYYRFTDRDGREVWGNLRIAEADEGRVGISYFHPGSETFSHKVFGAGDGLTVRHPGPRDHVVTYAGRSVRFHVPEVRTTAPASLRLDTSERYVGRIVDESGARFHLIFNDATNSFYMLLDESDGFADRLERGVHGLVLGDRTGFAYYDEADLDRRLLVGVRLSDIAENNYFDGPGDQVPFELKIRDLLHLAYPHTMLKPGIDEHGVMLGTFEWQRIAITPFQRYQRLDEVAERIRGGLVYDDPSARRTAMTKEWWNSPMWVAMKIYELRGEGRALAGAPPGLLSLEALQEQYPQSMFASAPEGPPAPGADFTSDRPAGTEENAS